MVRAMLGARRFNSRARDVRSYCGVTHLSITPLCTRAPEPLFKHIEPFSRPGNCFRTASTANLGIRLGMIMTRSVSSGNNLQLQEYETRGPDVKIFWQLQDKKSQICAVGCVSVVIDDTLSRIRNENLRMSESTSRPRNYHGPSSMALLYETR